MDFIVSIDDERGKSLIAFLKKLDFVVLKPFRQKRQSEAVKPPQPLSKPAYFGACPDWDMDADELRKKASPRRSI